MVEKDKVLHFLAGLSITLTAILSAWVWHKMTGVYLNGAALGLFFTALAAVGRELLNWADGGKFDCADILATLIGGAVVVIVWG